MPAKKGKRAATKAPAELEEAESNVENQEIDEQPANKRKGRGPKSKAVVEEAEQTEPVETAKKQGRSNKGTNDEETNEEVAVEENGNKTESKRGATSKKNQKTKDKGNAADTQRRGAERTVKKGTSMADEGDEDEEEQELPEAPTGRGRKANIINKGVSTEDLEKGAGDAEPTAKKSRGRAKAKETKDDADAGKPKRRGRAQKNTGKKGDTVAENEDEDDLIDGKQLRVAVEH